MLLDDCEELWQKLQHHFFDVPKVLGHICLFDLGGSSGFAQGLLAEVYDAAIENYGCVAQIKLSDRFTQLPYAEYDVFAVLELLQKYLELVENRLKQQVHCFFVERRAHDQHLQQLGMTCQRIAFREWQGTADAPNRLEYQAYRSTLVGV